MNTNFLNLKTRVMSRIYLEYAKNIFMDYSDYFMLALFFIISFLLISFHNVLNNIPKNNIYSTFNFFIVAIRDTSWIMQTLIAGFFIRVIFICSKLFYRKINTHEAITKFRY